MTPNRNTSTTFVRNHLVSCRFAPVQATPGAENLPRPLAELKQWIHGLPHHFQQSRAARLLNRLCDSPGQTLAWNAPGMQDTLCGLRPASVNEFGQLHQECMDLLQKHPIRGLWAVHPCEGDLPGIRLVPGGMMLDYIRDLRSLQTRRPD